MFKDTPLRNIIFIAMGVLVLLLKPHYSGPGAEIIYAYAGNVSVSFAVYFMFRATRTPKFGKLVAAGIALLVVELFEATDGFGVMSNTYDPSDFVANAIGVGLGLALDTALSGVKSRGEIARS